MEQNQLSAVGATRVNVGLSAVIRIQPQSAQVGLVMKIVSGGGTLEIVQPPVALSGSSASGWGAGYPVGTAEIMNISGPAAIYLVASGATMVVGIVPGYAGSGMTLV